MHLANWRNADAREFTDLWHAQDRRWADRLSWDNSSTWATLEAQRRDGLLPGLTLVDTSHVAAWSFFLVHRGTLQIGAFEANTAASTRVLLDAILSLADPEFAPAGAMLFAFSDAPDLSDALVERGFETDRYLYLTRDLAARTGNPPDLGWDPGVALQIPTLLGRSYDKPTLTRPFARHGLVEEWQEYAGQLMGSDACGRFAPRLSAARVASDGTLEGAVITTVIGPGCIHVAQVAVAPDRRGSGIANAMLQDVLTKASADGFAKVSLLVGEHNAGARRIYDGLGFKETAHFVSAGSPAAQPTRR